LIGQAGSRYELATPALIIDLDIFEHNLARMAEFARSRGVFLRPHAKTHKCAEIARRQMAAGALGVCTAKLGEAEALADAGLDSILITSPVVTERAIARLMQLNARIDDLMTVCDNPAIARRLAEAATHNGKKLKLLVDLDPGMGRTGVRPGEAAAALVRLVARNPAFEFKGLQSYAGNLQHLESRNERRDKSLGTLAELAEFCRVLCNEEIAVKLRTGGGTGTFDIDPDAGVLTELQVGSYIFMDRQYNDVWEKSGSTPPFPTALFVQTTVISANHDGLATTDAGFKAFATDAGPPQIVSGAPSGATYFFFGDEQGGILYSSDTKRLVPGDVVVCAVPHCDPTVNLYDSYHLVRGDRLEAIWSIEARGRSA
jgi:D-serine deaminase-like pyridoxal phosphate-dependent protein